MITTDFKGNKLSALGMGAMRLPVLNNDPAQIDETEVGSMVAYAMTQGVNYFDTAWGYHGGQSEVVLGKALKQHPRTCFYLANKFPGYDLGNMDKVEEIFEEQLKKCQVDYFDFYLFHNVCEMNIDAYLDESHGIHSYLMEQKENGRIRHLGFSIHGSEVVMKRFLEAYGKDMEFCQIQLNYMDWEFQDAKAKAALLGEYDIPIWVMEPLRGGQLATLSEDRAGKLAALRPEETIPAWAFRFTLSIPNVKMILSGMSNLKQIHENICTFCEAKPLNHQEMDTLLEIGAEIVKETALPCTACRYCVDHCPKGLDIPNLIGLYNEHRSTKMGFIAPMALRAVAQEKRPEACVGCKSCEAVCPQQIKIVEAMGDFAKLMA